MTDFKPLSVFNLPPIAKVLNVSDNTITLAGMWACRTASAFDRRGTVLCSNGRFMISDIVPDGKGNSVLVLSTPVYGSNTPSYAALYGVGGNSLFPLSATSLNFLPEEVRTILSPDFAIPEASLWNQYSSGNGFRPPQESITPDVHGNLQGYQQDNSNMTATHK